MGRSRIIQPESKRIPISDGDTIDVKARLNHGEREDFIATVAPFADDGKSHINGHALRTTRVLTFLLGWTLMDGEKPIAYSIDMSEQTRRNVLRSLDPETFDEIHDAISKHEDEVSAEREARKKIRDGANGLPAISPSPVITAGDTSGSES